MIKNHLTRKTIAVFFILNFLSTIVPYNGIFAQSSGPNAPEASSFEPVDATDMVNLLTGDFTYVLPLLNVPSPEGGYPIALSYHAGIAMDQEASWVGLGWNLNPGAINRNVNGAPDDYFESNSSDYFYSSEEKISDYHASIGYSFGGGASVGLSFSWGSNKSLGGSVSAGYGFDLGGDLRLGVSGSIGTNSSSIGLGLSNPSGLSFGANVSTNGNFGGSLGFSTNGNGFSISASSTGSVGVNLKGRQENTNGTTTDTSVGVNLSSGGLGINVASSTKSNGKKGSNGEINNSKPTSSGVGLSFLNFSSTIDMGDYTTSVNSWSMGLFVPIGLGFLNLGFGNTTVKYSLHKHVSTSLTGPIHFNKVYDYYVVKVSDGKEYCINTTFGRSCSKIYKITGYLSNNYTQQELNELIKDYPDYKIEALKDWQKSSMDILELPVAGNDLNSEKDILGANPTLPNYDKFTVQAQGLSGSISPRVYENGALFGFSDNVTKKGDKLQYLVNNKVGVANKFKFKKKTEFYFENEISTYIETPKSILQNTTNLISSYKGNQYSSGILSDSKSDNVDRRKTGNFIEYFTNEQIAAGKYKIMDKPEEDSGTNSQQGGISINILNFNFGGISTVGKFFERYPKEGIGAFKITAVDGKTYHYSLPVYNHEIIQRSYGTIEYQDGREGVKPEREAYFEKKQLGAFATHWLLTAVTGPDFVDVNNNNRVDKEDYGYWVEFDYGKYSDTFIWSGSYGRNYTVSPTDDNAKTWIRGRKEIYYLDKIKTRTHTALFVKSKRQDGKSIPFSYSSAKGDHNRRNVKYEHRFTIPEQYPLKLDKILLYKGNPGIGMGANQNTGSGNVDINYDGELSYGYEIYPKYANDTRYNTMNTVIDSDDTVITTDFLTGKEAKLIKSIEFDNNHYDLVKGTPNSDANGRLTLRKVAFKGKGNEQVLPPYKFNYINSGYRFDIDDKDDFGYNKSNNSLWSLREVVTPQGGKIKIDYEDHKIKSALTSKVSFSRKNESQYKLTIVDNYNIKLTSDKNLGFKLGDEIEVERKKQEYRNFFGVLIPTKNIIDETFKGTISSYNSNGKTANVSMSSSLAINSPFQLKDIHAFYYLKNEIIAGGARVKKVSTVDENNRYYTMEYEYGEEGNGIGYVTYLPFAPELTEELPYSSELPPSKPMYDFVSTKTYSTLGNNMNTKKEYGVKIQYEFNVLKNKEEGKIKFGDFYEIEKQNVYGGDTSARQLKSYTIKDNLGAIGQLLSVKTLNNVGQIMSKIENNYYGLGETPDKLGQTQESYQSYKRITLKNNSRKEIGLSTTRITYPNLLKNSTELRGGHSYTSEFNDLDPITGQARETYSYSSDGMKFLTKGIQAFRKYDAMGSKAIDVYNKNMLSQTAGEYNYIYKNNDWKEIGANITTWNNNWIYPLDDNEKVTSNDVWRKHKTFIWNGALATDNTYDNFVEFNWNTNASNTNWREITEITKYNQYSKPLEVKDINNNYASTKMGDNYTKVIATANAAYEDMYYSGAEYNDGKYKIVGSDNPFDPHITRVLEGGDYFNGEVKSFGYKKVNTEEAHTGNHIVEISTNQKAFEVNVPSRSLRNTSLKQRFKISVWVRKGDENKTRIVLNGSQKAFNPSEKIVANEWVQLTGYITIPVSGANVAITSTSGTIRLDDFRLHPISSSMYSYVYNEWDEVSYIMGTNGLSTHYIYDVLGRLIETQIETIDKISNATRPQDKGGFKRVSTNSYNYKNTNN